MIGPVVRALGIAVAFELKLLVRQLIPAFLLGTVMWGVLCSGLVGASALVPEEAPDRIALIVLDPGWQQALDDGVVSTFEGALDDVSVEIRTTAPVETADVEVWIPEDAARGAWRVVGTERSSVEPILPVVELAQAWVRQQVALDDAERERLFALEDTAEVVADALDDDGFDGLGTPRFLGCIAFVWGLMFGVGSVRQNTYKRDEGLATLLRIGTPRLSLYLVELFGSALVLSTMAGFTVLSGFVIAEDKRTAAAWICVGLFGMLALWMSSSLAGVVIGTVERERGQELHLDILLVPIGLLAAYLTWDLSGVALFAFGLVPLFGLLVVGAGEQPGLQTVVLLCVQLGWGIWAVDRGSWVFTLSEPLWDAVSRRARWLGRLRGFGRSS